MRHFLDASTRASKEIATGVHIRTFWGDRMLLSLVDIEPWAVVPNHTHPHEQSGVVLSGAAEMTIGEERKALKPGDLYVIPGGVEHSLTNGPQPTQVLDIFSPVREEYKY